MRVGFVVLYVTDTLACQDFWVNQVGMELRETSTAGDHVISMVGFRDQDFAFQLVPLALMADNPDNLDLATPSIGFRVNDLSAELERMRSAGVTTTDISDHMGMRNFAFCDNENRWFAVIENA